jgi:hypothetical protein
MARVNTNTIDGITAASKAALKPKSAVNTNTIDGITAASNAAPATAPVADPRIALRKLQSGEALTDDEKRFLGLPVAAVATVSTDSTDSTPKWTKAATITTANGPVDVDANGLAQDGSRPVAVVANTNTSGVPAGFTAGPFPKELEQFFGSSAGIIGYRIITNSDGSQQLEVADGPTSSKTFGFKFTKDNGGRYVKFTSSAGGVVGDGTGTKLKTPEQIAADEKAALGQAERQSAYDLLYSQFKLYGLESLVEPLKGLIVSGASPAEFTIKLRDSDAYQLRFAANKKRIANGFKAIDEATYLALEDRYQSIMQNYGLPESYYKKGSMGVQEKFEDLISKNVDPVTLEERVVEGIKINKGSKTLIDTAKQFYPNLNDGDFLSYAIDPKNALADIRRKVTAIEIGGAAVTAGLQAGVTRAEELGTAGITGAQAQQGFKTIAGGLQRGSQLASIYGENPYTQTTAEQEVFGLAGQTEAEKQRKKLTGLEKATFSGQTGLTSGALARDRAGAY